MEQSAQIRFKEIKHNRIEYLDAVKGIGKVPDINVSFCKIGNPIVFIPAACAGSACILLLCKNTIVGKLSAFQFLGKNSLIIMALHMDIPIQIAWIVMGATGLSSLLSKKCAAICAISIELVILIFMVLVINRVFPFLLRPLRRKTI